VRSRITGCVLALKRVSKEGITNYNALMTQFRERKNMIRLGSNPHTVTLHATFESREHFNFLLDYYPGGELFLHLTEPKKKLTLSDVKRYFCEILLAMEHIHRKKVLYRDLKVLRVLCSQRTSLWTSRDTCASGTSA
jgi:serine/threonine protein kinase